MRTRAASIVDGVDWAPLWDTLSNLRVGWVLAASAILVFESVLRALRWRVLLRPASHLFVPNLALSRHRQIRNKQVLDL